MTPIDAILPNKKVMKVLKIALSPEQQKSDENEMGSVRSLPALDSSTQLRISKLQQEKLAQQRRLASEKIFCKYHKEKSIEYFCRLCN